MLDWIFEGILQLDPGAIKWVAEKFPVTEKVGAAAQLIRDFAPAAVCINRRKSKWLLE